MSDFLQFVQREYKDLYDEILLEDATLERRHIMWKKSAELRFLCHAFETRFHGWEPFPRVDARSSMYRIKWPNGDERYLVSVFRRDGLYTKETADSDLSTFTHSIKISRYHQISKGTSQNVNVQLTEDEQYYFGMAFVKGFGNRPFEFDYAPYYRQKAVGFMVYED